VEIGGKSYTWTFICADVKFPILGVDFLRKFNLVVDVVAEQLLPEAMAMAARLSCRSNGSMVAMAAAELEDWKAVLNEFPGVIQPLSCTSQPAHGVEHHIVTAGRRNFAGWTKPSWPLQKKNSTRCCKLASFARRPASGPALSTWSGKWTAVAGHAATIAAST
jgi:hypothetical protein